MTRLRVISVGILLVSLASPAFSGVAVEVAKIEHRGGESLRLTLSPEMGDSWREVNVGRVAMRSAGRQERVADDAFQPSRHLDLELADDGCSLVLVNLGPPSAKGRSDSWRRITRSTKILSCPERGNPYQALRERARTGAMAMAKVGGRIEIRPYVNPALMRAGSDLPVRIYFENSAQAGVEVLALGPQGRRLSAVTDAVGVANFTLPVSGRWVIRYTTLRDAAAVVAELEFDVPPETFWNALPAPGGGK
ncbi:MAG: DUF4198 domain-containing protein [bacterium]|nr:DUF4198 domain-containing protein [bacterium]